MQNAYEMAVDRNMLDHLGINLYSNFAAVLTETVANAWDADAGAVDIHIGRDRKRIQIVDDGVGMSVDEMNRKYLRVGYRRREEDPEHGKLTAGGRKVMGRKGLGKLSLFSIAKIIEVQSAKNGERHGLRMSFEEIQESLKNKERTYRPVPLANEDITVENGTKIVLEEIKHQRLATGAAALRRRLARRFSIIGESDGFRIIINGEEITPDDRSDLPIAQFLWTFGDFDPDPSSSRKLLEREQLPDRCADWPTGWNVKGWIGTSHHPKQLASGEAGDLNGIVVFARGRLFHENILDKVNDGRLYTKYLTGQIEADFLDDDDLPDIATSDRQRVQEDDERYAALVSFLRSSLTRVESRWTQWRREHEVTNAKNTHPALAEWFGTLPQGFAKSAEKLIAGLSALPIDNEEDRKILYRHGILAFERMRMRGSTQELIDSVHDIDKLLTVLADRDALEASLYRDIVESRLDAIRRFQRIVDEHSKERALQQYLFDHLWLLDPAWERATQSDFMESRLAQKGLITDDLTEKQRLARVDIAYRTNAGKHIIVELKRADRTMRLLELVEQGQRYFDTLAAILQRQGEALPDIEVIFVLGKPVTEETSNPTRLKLSMATISPGSRIVHYDSLLRGAENAYYEYLQARKDLDKLEGIVNRI